MKRSSVARILGNGVPTGVVQSVLGGWNLCRYLSSIPYMP